MGENFKQNCREVLCLQVRCSSFGELSSTAPLQSQASGKVELSECYGQNCVKCHLLARVKSKMNGRCFGRNINIFKTLSMMITKELMLLNCGVGEDS